MAEPVFDPLAPREAVRFFRAKGFHVAYSWLDTAAEEYLRSFTVAKAMGLDILEDIVGAVDEAIAFETFQERLEPILKRKGWWGRQKMTDPVTGETQTVQLDSPRRLRIVFDTDIRMAYAKGQWERIERRAASAPWLRAMSPSRTPAHAPTTWPGRGLCCAVLTRSGKPISRPMAGTAVAPCSNSANGASRTSASRFRNIRPRDGTRPAPGKTAAPRRCGRCRSASIPGLIAMWARSRQIRRRPTVR